MSSAALSSLRPSSRDLVHTVRTEMARAEAKRGPIRSVRVFCAPASEGSARALFTRIARDLGFGPQSAVQSASLPTWQCFSGQRALRFEMVLVELGGDGGIHLVELEHARPPMLVIEGNGAVAEGAA